MTAGLSVLLNASTDVKILVFQRFLRMFAYGQTSLILVIFLEKLGIPDNRIGLFMTLTLLGDVILSWFLTFQADHLGRRLVVKVGCFAMMMSGVVFALSSNYWLLLIAAVFGVVSSSGDDTGPFKAVEESMLAHLSSPEDLPDLFAWHGIIGTIGSALGTLSSGWLVELDGGARLVFWCYVAISLIKWASCMLYSEACEEEPSSDGEQRPLLQNEPSSSPEKLNFTLLTSLCILFGIDSLGYGFMSNSWLVVYFKSRFGVSESRLGTLLFITTILGSVTQLFSSAVSKLVGPVLGMVVTKLPSAASMATIPLGKTVDVCMGLLLIRTATDSMDVVPRQVFLSTVMARQHRTKVMGTVNVVKTLTRAIGPYFTGQFASMGSLNWAFAAVGIFEAVYGILLVSMFIIYRRGFH